MLTRASKIRADFVAGRIGYLQALRTLTKQLQWSAVHADHYLMLGLRNG